MSLYECVNSDPSANVDPFGLDCCGPDVTDWFVKELNIHSAFFRQHREAGHGLPFISYAKRIPYKWLIFKTENCPAGDKCKDTVTLAGHCIHKSDLGNIMFGAIGKQWLANERLLIWGGVRAAKRSKTGGIDSVEDMASSIAGLLVGDQLRELKADEALTVAAFSAAIASDPTKIKQNLLDYFTPDIDKLINGVTPDAISATAKPYADCPPCNEKVPKDQAHSDFGQLKIDGLRGNPDRWWGVYEGVKSEVIDNSQVPFPDKGE